MSVSLCLSVYLSVSVSVSVSLYYESANPPTNTHTHTHPPLSPLRHPLPAAPTTAAASVEKYINNDSTHGVRHYKVIVVDKNTIQVGSGPTTSSYRTVKLLRSRVPEELAWRENGVDILFETTGAFMTTKDMARHDVDYVILSAPPKDLNTTPMFVYGVNDRDYNGEAIISAASCTTNCIAPFLAAANQIAGGIRDANFITVHAATSSQSIVDEAHDSKRTNRSIFNNIIPHTT